MSYITEHASALSDVRVAGVDVLFVLKTKTYDASTGRTSLDAATLVPGAAMRVPGDKLRYSALGLTHLVAVTLFFVPSTYGDDPPLGSECTWAGRTMRVKDVDPFGPDGKTIYSSVVIAP